MKDVSKNTKLLLHFIKMYYTEYVSHNKVSILRYVNWYVTTKCILYPGLCHTSVTGITMHFILIMCHGICHLFPHRSAY